MKQSTGNLLEICIVALLAAIVFAATAIGVPFGPSSGSYFHFGCVPLVVAAIVFGKRQGALAGAIGSALFDILSHYFIWAPFTLVIRLAMGYMIGLIAQKKQGKSLWRNTVATLLAGAILVAGYYFAEVILFGSWLVAFESVPANLMQAATMLVLGLPLAILIQHRVKFSWHEG